MSVLIGVPCGGGFISEQTTVGLFNLGKILVRNNIHHSILTLSNSSLITQARSRISNFFVNNTNHEYLFFLDSDIGFDPNDVLKLLNYDLDLVCGTYPMKSLEKQYCVSIKIPENKNGDLIEINGGGMGFSLIKRKVFTDISQKYPGLKYIPSQNNSEYPYSKEEMKNSYHYFAETKLNNQFMSEDYSFFRRVMEVGYNIWLDSSIKLLHTGYHIYGE